jgi:hypothetical protein
MGPRRMDGFGRSAGPTGPRAQSAGRPPAIGLRPTGQSGRPVRSAGVRPTPADYEVPTREQLVATQPKRAAPSAKTQKRGGLKVALQFVAGLVIIVAVAGTIVWLYGHFYG